MKPPIGSALLVVGAFIVAAGCDGGSSSPTNEEAPQATTHETTIPVTAQAPLLTFQPIGSIDLSSQAALYGKSVHLRRGPDETVSRAATQLTPLMAFTLPDETVISIRLPAAPNAPGVPVRLLTNGSPPDSEHLPVIYVYAPGDESTDDVVQPVATTYLIEDRLVEATLPPSAFVRSGTEYVARVTIGLASWFMPDSQATQSRIQSTATWERPLDTSLVPRARQIECPIDTGCIERSRYNPQRLLGGQLSPHFGMDLRAALSNPADPRVGAPVYVQAGATLIAGTTPTRYASLSPKPKCGVSLTFDLGRPAPVITFCHLSSIQATLVDTNPSNVRRVSMTARTLVGFAGDTGTDNVHLHLNAYLLASGYCKKQRSATQCQLVYESADPFPNMIDSFELIEPNAGTIGAMGQRRFRARALDRHGIEITSAVGNAVESLPGDPSRKQCFRDTLGALHWYSQFGRYFSDLTDSAQAFCVPWGQEVLGHARNQVFGSTEVQVRYTLDQFKFLDTVGSIVARKSIDVAAFSPVGTWVAVRFTNVAYDRGQLTLDGGGAAQGGYWSGMLELAPIPSGSTWTMRAPSTISSDAAADISVLTPSGGAHFYLAMWSGSEWELIVPNAMALRRP